MTIVLRAEGLAPSAGLQFAVAVAAGECVNLAGPEHDVGTVLRMLAGEVRCDSGRILVHHCGEDLDLAGAAPWRLVEARRLTIAYLGGPVRVLPHVPALDAVAEPAIRIGRSVPVAHATARRLLGVLRVPEALWDRPASSLEPDPLRRVAAARAFAVDVPVLLLDDPTEGLDEEGRAIVLRLVRQAKRRGSAVIGAFRDEVARAALADRTCALHDSVRGAA